MQLRLRTGGCQLAEVAPYQLARGEVRAVLPGQVAHVLRSPQIV